MRGAWAKLRLKGYRRCEWTVARHSAWEGKAYSREKGEQCREFCTPEQIKRMGIPVCPTHEPFYLAALKSTADRVAAQRAKLDPGCSVE